MRQQYFNSTKPQKRRLSGIGVYPDIYRDFAPTSFSANGGSTSGMTVARNDHVKFLLRLLYIGINPNLDLES